MLCKGETTTAEVSLQTCMLNVDHSGLNQHWQPSSFHLCAMLAAWLEIAAMASRFAHQPLLSRLKYLSNYGMDWHEILYRHSWSPDDESMMTLVVPWLFLGPPAGQQNISTSNGWMMQTFMVPRKLILLTFVIPWLFHEIDIFGF